MKFTLFAPGLAMLAFAAVSTACIDYWDGTAPFCHGGSCKPGFHQTREDKHGDGKKCLSGHKIFCECNPPQPTSTWQDYWAGTAPFCKGQCLDGYREIATSNSGNGGLCWTGHKALCQRIKPGPHACEPQVPIKQTCVGFFLVCNNGCNTFGCGLCFSSGKRSVSISRRAVAPGSFVDSPTEGPPPADDNLYKSLAGDYNDQLRKTLPGLGIDVPEDLSPEAIAGYGMHVLESTLADLRAVDPTESYKGWGDTDVWVTAPETSE